MRATGGRRASGIVHAVLTRRQAVPATGVPISWSTALERFAHGVHRYHDRVEVIPDRSLRRQLQDVGETLDGALATARAAGRHRDGHGPEEAQAVRDVLRAGTLCAHAIEAAVAATTARRAGDAEGAARAVSTARTVAALVNDLAEGRSPEPLG